MRNSNVVPGPWDAKITQSQPRLVLCNEAGEVLETFTDYESAIRYREEHDLQADWRISDANGDEPSSEDRLYLLAMILRDHLKSHWRAAQFDRMMDGVTRQIPSVLCDDLQTESGLAAAAALNAAGHEGWSAVSGELKRGSDIHEHVWLINDDGSMLDFMADRFAPRPVVAISENDGISSYTGISHLEQQADAPWADGLAQKILAVLPGEDREPVFDF